MKGRCLWADEERVLISRGQTILESRDSGNTWLKLMDIPCSPLLFILSKFALLNRLLRFDIHHFLILENNTAVCIFYKSIVWLDLNSKTVVRTQKLQGNRPLSFVKHKNTILYGEYRSNPERSDVCVWRADVDSKQWVAALTLNRVRHIHGVYVDPQTSKVWVTTGDENQESKVLLLNENLTIEEVLLEGSQQTRIVQPVFTENFVYFGSDAPNEINYIYQYRRSDGKLICQQEVGGPVYFGQAVGEVIFFATVAEPSKVNSEKIVQLWASKSDSDWQCIEEFEKDPFSLKYFQYGHLIFPNQNNKEDYLLFTEFATKSHLRLHIVDIPKLLCTI